MESNELILLTLPQVIDAALTGPEMGLVSYGLLGNILHIICQQMNLQDVKVQYKGAQAIQLQKIWNPEMKSKVPSITGVKKAGISSAGPPTDDKIVVVPDRGSENLPAMTLAISTKQLHLMEKKIFNLEQEVAGLRSLPSNNDLFKAVKKKSGDPSPIIDMYQILSLRKKMEATEEAVTKIATFVEDLAKYVYGELVEGSATVPVGDYQTGDKTGEEKPTVNVKPCGKCPDDVCVALDTPGKCRRKVTPSTGVGVPVHRLAPPTLDIGSLRHLSIELEKGVSEKTIPTIGTVGSTDSEQNTLPGSLKSGETISLTVSEHPTSEIGPLMKTKLNDVRASHLPNNEALDLLQKELINLRKVVETLVNKATYVAAGEDFVQEITLESPRPSKDISESDSPPREDVCQTLILRIEELEANFNEFLTKIDSMDDSLHAAYRGINHRMVELESTLKVLTRQTTEEIERGTSEEQLFESLYALNDRVVSIENVMSKLTDATSLLLEDNTTKQGKIMSLLNDVDYLKSDKISREEFSDALSNKVDLCMISKKVSHEQFNATCDDLSRGLEEALEKLFEQEELWHLALKEIHDEISAKLGREELVPLKEFITAKMKGLQLRLKALAKLKREQEAAASKSKFLKDVQCISCDRNVIMRKKLDESVNYSTGANFPGHKSVAPYLAYEMDNLRKQQKEVPGRYCGGAHTITTRQQRAARCNFIVEDWGTKPVPMEEVDLFCKQAHIEEGVTSDDMKVFKKPSIQISNNLEQAEKDGSKTSFAKSQSITLSEKSVPKYSIPKNEGGQN